MKTETINVVACEYCGHSERYRSPEQVGSDLDIYDVVRARVCRHEQRCGKNPLVKTIIDIRELLDAFKSFSFSGFSIGVDNLKRLQKMIQEIRQKTFDCFGPPIEKPCDHKKTYTDRIDVTETDIEVCKDCGMSRAIYEAMEPSRWLKVDIEAAKKQCPECFDDPIGKKTCGYCNPKPIKPPPKKLKIQKVKKSIVKPGAVAVGSNVQVVSRRKPGAVKAKRKRGSSKYFGVSYKAGAGKWTAQIYRADDRWYGGCYKIEEDAAIAVQEHLGNAAESARIRAVRDKKYPPVETAAEKVITKEIDKFKGDYTWQWSCKGCGNIVHATTNRCNKCHGSAFEKIRVLNNPQEQLDRPEGRHNNL